MTLFFPLLHIVSVGAQAGFALAAAQPAIIPARGKALDSKSSRLTKDFGCSSHLLTMQGVVKTGLSIAIPEDLL